MIAKHVPMRSLGKSDFAGLVKYITADQAKEHRIGEVRLTNCVASTVRDAVTEVLATQHANTRAKSDKTYHLLVSFRAGEQPDAATLEAIEARICAGLGFSDHQRVSAVHHDTDNLHVHIAINKIHPTRNTVHEPYYPHRTLAELCDVLERSYGLQRDNHAPRRRGAESRAADMERHSGIESLVGWIKRECMEEIRGARSWAELHQVMRANGLEIRTKGNGLVIEAGSGTQIKASTLGRDFSKAKLEGRYGPFDAVPGRQADVSSKRQYQRDPIRLRVNTVELYAKYQIAQQRATTDRATAQTELRRQKEKQVENAKRKGLARRAAIKLLGVGRLTKKVLYAQASGALKSELEAIYKQHRVACQRLYEQHRRHTWTDWLKQEALQGNAEALTALRAREAAQGLKGSTIKAEGRPQPGHAPVIDNITKTGTIIYRAGSSAVRDDGDRLQVSGQAGQECVQQAIRLAVERYGDRITVAGSAEFKARVIRAAIDMRLPIMFDDPSMERLRQQYMATRQSARVSRPAVKPVGSEPPPQARNRLRTLSQLEMLSIKGGDQAVSHHSVNKPIAGDPARRQVEQAAQQAVSRFKAVANRRKVRANGYGDQGKAWQNLPDELRQRIDRFNSQSPERQEIELTRMRREAVERRGGELPSLDGATRQKGRSR
ncbi:TraI/MobA(P) family conjugative relaxase [Burkholderia pseudomallei]|uniref:TraI/MobA(P) family conjugative relaxase n=1 Tax=Burkholderia pseudomallei TaxID=28450 RepID=UPI000811B157|nr:TraI/MobA(P) family conjugative relaxase [Burkholderia pseudomallei]ANW51718.1 conjugal transfer protein TrbI [Burkholderia pseudomallei]ANW57713.1 conjugal transfer protein TrbI [Burkholderia pseudomallei]MCS6596442.1 relaxase/mobilization nuclease domain-containing protein [Burkholderia pseudomallei]